MSPSSCNDIFSLMTCAPPITIQSIDHFGADVTVMSLQLAFALWWQKNTGNKWRKTVEIHQMREKRSCAFECQNRNEKDGLYFYKILSSNTPFTQTFMVASH